MFRGKNKTKENSIHCYPLLNWNPCGMCLYEKKVYHNSKWQAEQSGSKHTCYGSDCYELQRK